MDKEHRAEILENLVEFDKCRLECDGLSRVLSYILAANNIDHKVYVGEIIDTTTGNQFAPHFWIDLPDGQHIDYRARMWLGDYEQIPHGIFDPTEYPVKYTGKLVEFENLDMIAPLLIKLECPD
jgi:hypothetical protein